MPATVLFAPRDRHMSSCRAKTKCHFWKTKNRTECERCQWTWCRTTNTNWSPRKCLWLRLRLSSWIRISWARSMHAPRAISDAIYRCQLVSRRMWAAISLCLWWFRRDHWFEFSENHFAKWARFRCFDLFCKKWRRWRTSCKLRRVNTEHFTSAVVPFLVEYHCAKRTCRR